MKAEPFARRFFLIHRSYLLTLSTTITVRKVERYRYETNVGLEKITCTCSAIIIIITSMMILTFLLGMNTLMINNVPTLHVFASF